ncbi:hypothetical protein WJX72_003380 [[Myrmecia] bisecta]|uniref:Cytoplasmic tRNA 2-thiolation protein 1 n=1 Tax=[Myrmecia] bisecta TaxID=41462 RepID=A0AAW1QEM2_9CHLO
MSPKQSRKGRAAAQAAARKKTSAVLLTSASEAAIRDALQDLPSEPALQQSAPDEAHVAGLYRQLEDLDFAASDIQASLKALAGQVYSLKAALDWLCLHVDPASLPARFALGAPSRASNISGVQVLSRAQNQRDGETKRPGQAAPPAPVPAPVPQAEAAEQARQRQLEQAKETAEQRAWIRQYMEGNASSDDSEVDDWEVWAEPAEKEARRVERLRDRLPPDVRRHQVVQEWGRARAEAAAAKAAKDKARQKAAGKVISSLKQEMQQLGLTGDLVEADVGGPASAASDWPALHGMAQPVVGGEVSRGVQHTDEPPTSQPAQGPGPVNTSSSEDEPGLGLFDEDSLAADWKAAPPPPPRPLPLPGKCKKLRQKCPPGKAATSAPPAEAQMPKALLQQLCQRQQLKAPRFERLPAGGLRLSQPGYRYRVVMEEAPPRPGGSRRQEQAGSGLRSFSLSEEEDGWETINDAQNAAAALAFFELEGDDSIRLPSPFDELWKGWREAGVTRAAKDPTTQQEQQDFIRSLVLPVLEIKAALLAALDQHDVAVVSGDTGCGKTTQVPQYLLEAAIDSGCGGILLRRMAGDPSLQRVSHVVVDEVHERTLQGDFLMALLKDLVQRRQAAGTPLKVVLMSATLDSDLFARYYGGCPVLAAGGRMFAVEHLFLEDAYEQTAYLLDGEGPAALRGKGRADSRRAALQQSSGRKHSMMQAGWGDDEAFKGPLNPDYKEEFYEAFSVATRRNLARVDESRIDYELLEELVRHITDNISQTGALLVFLPGMGEINNLCERLMSSAAYRNGKQWVIPLHSSVSPAEQRQAFRRPSAGIRKIVVATNIAEASLTIEDVEFVIDTGKLKERRYDANRGMSLLVEDWVSRASALQRKGRAGRVKAGMCFGLYTRHRFEHRMRNYQAPEMMRVPLDELLLQIYLLRLGPAANFLQRVLQPPPDKSVGAAIVQLQELGAISSQEQLTPLGHHLALLPVDARIGKLLVMATVMGVLAPCLTIAACLSYRSPFAVGGADQDSAARERLAAAGSNTLAAGQLSDHLLMAAAFEGWSSAQHQAGRQAARSFARQHGMSEQTLDMLADMRGQFASMLGDIKFLAAPPGTSRSTPAAWIDDLQQPFNRYAKRPAVIKGVLCAALYPNVAVMDDKQGPGSRPAWHDGAGEVSIHPASSLHPLQADKFLRPFLVFLEKVRTSKVFLRDCTVQAVLRRPKTFQQLCRACFYTAFEGEVHQTIVSNNLFQAGQRVALGASGGKDSTVLAHVLTLLNKRHHYGLDLILLSIDEGITGYRDDSLETVKRNEKQYQVPLKIVSYKELYGWSMDEIVKEVGMKNNCTFCGVFRRQALDRGAALLRADKIATGHNADDLAETVLLNILRGDTPRLSRCVAAVTGEDNALPRIKPFKYTYEKEIVMYAYFKKLDYFSTECIYAPYAARGFARDFVKDLEAARPRAIIDLIHSAETFRMAAAAELALPTPGTCQRLNILRILSELRPVQNMKAGRRLDVCWNM